MTAICHPINQINQQALIKILPINKTEGGSTKMNQKRFLKIQDYFKEHI